MAKTTFSVSSGPKVEVAGGERIEPAEKPTTWV